MAQEAFPPLHRLRWMAAWAWTGWLVAVVYGWWVAPFPGPPVGPLTLYTLVLWALAGAHALGWTWLAWEHGPWASWRRRVMAWLWGQPQETLPPRATFGLLFAAFWALFSVMPASINEVWAPYLAGFRPYAGLLAITTVLYLVEGWWRHRERAWRWWRTWARERWAWLAAGAVLGALVLGIAWTRLGFHPQPVTWQDPAPPLVVAQVLMALAAGWLLGWFWNRPQGRWPRRLLRVGLLLGLVVFTGWFWEGAPIGDEGFVRFPPPHNRYTPVSDARVFDRAAQAALVGDHPVFWPWDHHALLKALYWGLHALVGVDVEPVVRVQVWLLTLWPLALFGLGYRLASPQVGFTAALLLVFQQRNAMALGSWITAGHPKLLIAAPWTALGVTALTLGMVLALMHRRATGWAMALGGGLVVLSLIRLNPLGLAPLFAGALAAAWWSRRQWWVGLWALVAFTVGLSAAWLPWLTYASASTQYPPWRIFQLWRNIPSRKLPVTPTPTPTPVPPTPTPGGQESGAFGRARPGGSSGFPVGAGFAFAVHRWSRPLGLPATEPLPRQEVLLQPRALYLFAEHAAHNLVGVFMQLPTFPFASFPYLGKLAWAVPYWKPDWDGWIPPSEKPGLVAWLVLLAIGLGEGLRRRGWAGVFPALVLGTYAVAVAVGSSSGGRYLPPMLWVVHLYAAWGLHTVLREVGLWPREAGDSQPEDSAHHAQGIDRRPLLVWLVFPAVLLGVTYPVLNPGEPQYPPPHPRLLLQAVEDDAALREALEPYWPRLEALLQERGRVVYGRMLYPAFWPQGTRLYQLPFYPSPLPASGLTFEIVGNVPRASFFYSFLLPLAEPPRAGDVPHGADAYVVLCGRLAYLLAVRLDSAWAVLVAEPARTMDTWTCDALAERVLGQ